MPRGACDAWARSSSLIVEREHAPCGKTVREIGYGWRSLDIAKPKQRVGRGTEGDPPIL
jgi:hypothetical protein